MIKDWNDLYPRSNKTQQIVKKTRGKSFKCFNKHSAFNFQNNSRSKSLIHDRGWQILQDKYAYVAPFDPIIVIYESYIDTSLHYNYRQIQIKEKFEKYKPEDKPFKIN